MVWRKGQRSDSVIFKSKVRVIKKNFIDRTTCSGLHFLKRSLWLLYEETIECEKQEMRMCQTIPSVLFCFVFCF